jgi:hypothetical protein
MENSGNEKKKKEERNGLTLTGLLMEGVEVERFVILSKFGVSLAQVLLEDCVMCELLANLH